MSERSSRYTAAVAAALIALASGACWGRSDDRRGAANSSFRVGIVEPATLDPSRARTAHEMLLADQLFDGLAAYDPKTLEPVPSLASAWTSTDDQQHWDFTLREGAVFSDGTPITSADVKATFDRIARRGSESSVSDLIELVSGYGAVALDGTSTDLAGVTAPSPGVVHIDLDQPMSMLPSVLANPAFGVVPAALAAGDAKFDEASPVGSGPFRVESNTRGVLRLRPAKGTRARSERVNFHFFEDKAASYKAFTEGKLHWSEVPAGSVPDATKRFKSRLYRPYIAELFYAFNLRNSKFSDIRFREAILRAVDRAGIIHDIYRDTVRPLDTLLIDGLGGTQAGACSACAYDPERSKALVAELTTEGASVPEVQIDFEDDKTQAAVASAIKDDLAAVGITATLRPKPLAEYQQFAVSGEQELFRLGWIAPYASADAILAPLFTTGSPNNLTGFSSAAVDEAIRSARASADPAARLEAHRTAERMLLADLPILPIAQFDLHSVAAPRVRGLVISATGTFDCRTVWLAPSA